MSAPAYSFAMGTTTNTTNLVFLIGKALKKAVHRLDKVFRLGVCIRSIVMLLLVRVNVGCFVLDDGGQFVIPLGLVLLCFFPLTER